MPMKVLIFILFLVSAPLYKMGNDGTWLLSLHSKSFPDHNDEWIFSDKILTDNLIMNFKIREIDTIYIDNIRNDEGRRSLNMWHSGELIEYTVLPDTVFQYQLLKNKDYYKNEMALRRLLSSWERDLIRHIGNEAQQHIRPTITHYLSRIIINHGTTKIDTVKFHALGEIGELTNNQLDSLREVIRLNKLYAKTDSLNHQTEKDSLFTTITGKKDIEKVSPTINPPQSSPSIWQRIVDWFRKLWKAIFG